MDAGGSGQTLAWLWLAVAGSGFYHGINPGMGWPLAVSAGLMGNGWRDVVGALGPLALGHFLAMTAVLLPFAAMTVLITWQTEIRIGAGLLVLLTGIWLLVSKRHPRFLARIRPTQLALWSFAIAMAHGAGLMLLPIYLGICGADASPLADGPAMQMLSANLGTAVIVSIVHTAAMVACGGAAALAVHGWLGPQFISRAWFNLDAVWACSLILVGGLGIWGAL